MRRLVVAAVLATSCGSSPPTVAEAATCDELARAVFAVLADTVDDVDAMPPEQLAGPDGQAVFDDLLGLVQQARTQANRLCDSEAEFDARLDPLLDDLDPQSVTGGLLVSVVRG